MANLKAIWTEPFAGNYAPVHLTFLTVLFHAFGREPFGFHLAQLLLHAACVCLLYLTLKELESPRIALVASLLFAVHPTNIETVAWIAQTKSTLSFLFFLLSFLAFLRLRSSEQEWHAIPCALFLVLSLLSKITTVVAPLIFLLHDYRQGVLFKRSHLKSLLVFFLIGGLFVAIHMMSFFWSENTLTASGLGGTYYGSFQVHLQNLPFFLWFYVWMTFFPYAQTAYHVFPIHEQFDWMVASAWVALLAASWILLRRDRTVRFWVLWFLVFLAPVLQIIPNLNWVAERYLYIPAIGIFVLVARMFFYVWERISRVSLRWAWESVLAGALLLLAWRADAYLPVFRNDLTLWEATAPTCPTSGICREGFGAALLEDHQIERGMNEMIRAVELRPHPEVFGRLADAYTLQARDYPQAIRAYNLAIQQATAAPELYSSVEFYAKLARAYLMAGNRELAAQALQAGRAANPLDPYVLVVESFYQSSQGNREKSLRSLQAALAVTGHVPTAETTGVPAFLYTFWGNAADVGRLLRFLTAEPGQTAAN